MKVLPLNIFLNLEKPFIKHNKLDIYKIIYESIINEHAKNLYTPYGLLNDMIENCIHYNYGSFILQYTYKDIVKYIDAAYKYNKQFWLAINAITDVQKFQIYLVYINPQLDIEYEKFYQYFSASKVSYIISACKTVTGEAACISNEFGSECFIVLNKNLLDMNYNNLEKVLDHELNHYFQMVDNNLDKTDSSKVINNKIKKIAYDCGYDLDNPDNALHLLKQSEFISMTADVCNIIEKYNITYYEWLEKCNESYITSKTFLQQYSKLQDALFFSFMTRWLDHKRWNILKQSVYIQLNNPKINLLKSAKEMLNTFLMRI